MSNECAKKMDSIQQFVQSLAQVALADSNKFGNSFYKLSTNRANWSRAVAECSKMGAHIAVVDSDAEDRFLAQMVQDLRSPVWLGVTAQQMLNSQIWLRSKNCLVYTERFLTYYNRNNVNCGGDTYYVCEYKLMV